MHHRGSYSVPSMFDFAPRVLIECDPSIKSIIVNIDSENHDYIIEDLDEERVVVKENMVPLLKQKLEDRLKENLPPVDESGSE
ncbi:TFIIH complex subunit tfb5 [Lecanicillium sp. MT-2017a]|nr:TFIIH complex subunit tfb5 [Lecanicillium sp. MT-2017a]